MVIQPTYYSGSGFAVDYLGNMSANSFIAWSSINNLKNINYINASSSASILQSIKNIKIAKYDYKNATTTDNSRLGIVAEDAPKEILSNDGKGIDIYKLSAFILAGIQEQQRNLDNLHASYSNGELVFDTSLKVNATTTLSNGLITNKILASGDILSIMSDTDFVGRPYFTKDTGGSALIKKGSRSVDIKFDRDYIETPIVNATVAFNEVSTSDSESDSFFNNDIRFLITNRSTHGFTIKINKAASENISFNWTALAVKNAALFTSADIVGQTNNITNPVINNPIINNVTNTISTTTSSTPANTVDSSTSSSTNTASTTINNSNEIPTTTPTIINSSTPDNTSTSSSGTSNQTVNTTPAVDTTSQTSTSTNTPIDNSSASTNTTVIDNTSSSTSN